MVGHKAGGSRLVSVKLTMETFDPSPKNQKKLLGPTEGVIKRLSGDDEPVERCQPAPALLLLADKRTTGKPERLCSNVRIRSDYE